MRRLSSRAWCACLLVLLSVSMTASRLIAQGPPPTTWQAYYSHYYSNATNADSVGAGPATFNQGWSLRLSAGNQTTATNATITATADASVTPLTAFVTNGVVGQTGPTQFSWSAATLASNQFMEANLGMQVQATYDRGFDAFRTLSGGAQANQRVVAGGATELRTYTLNVTPQAADISYLSMFVQMTAGSPGPKPVVPTVQNCSATQGTVFVNAGNVNWFVNGPNGQALPAQAAVELTCTVSVQNTDPTPSLWMPDASVSAGSMIVNSAPTIGSTVSFTSNPGSNPPDLFGSATWSATVPAGTFYTLQTSFSRGTTFLGEDRAQNRPPTVSLPPTATMSESTTFTLPLSANGFDQDNDPLTYSWQILSFTGNSPGVLQASGGPNQRAYSNSDGPSTATIQVTVTDPSGASASATTVVTTQNTAPQLFVPPSFLMGLGNPISPCATVNDSGVSDSPWLVSVNWGDGSPLEQVTASPGPCTGVGVAHVQPTHLYTHAGSFQLTWNATDKDGGPTSGTTPVTISKTPPSFTTTSGPSPASPGQPVTFSMTVTRPSNVPPSIVAPTGTVTFTGPAINTTVPLDATGKAAFVTSTLPQGPSTITMLYNGDGNYSTASTTRTVTVSSQPSAPSVSLFASPNPVNYGSSVTFTININGNVQVPSGSVSLFIPGSPSMPFGSRLVTTNGTTGTATFTVSGLAVGPHTFQAVYNSSNPGLTGGSATTSVSVQQPSAISFSQLTPISAGACLCTPTMMNTDVFGAEHWFVKAAGASMTVGLSAVPVNTNDPGSVTMRIRDAAGTLLSVTTASYPVGSTVPATASATVPTTAGAVYRVEITTPGVSPLQPHYRLKFENALEAGLPSPSYNSFEEYTAADVPQPWLFNVASGERLAVFLGAPTLASLPAPTTVTVSLVDLSAPGVPVPLVDPANPSGPSVTTVTVSNPSGITGLPLTMATAASSSSVYALLLHNVNGHFRLSRQDAAADRGIYLSWFGSGDGSVKFNISAGNLTLDPSFQVGIDITHVLSGNDMGHRMLPIGVTDVDEADTGTYHLHLTAPAGFVVSPADLDVNVLCDQLLEINVSVSAVTSTTISASSITFGQNGVITVQVASPGGSVSGDVSLSIDGGASLTAAVSSGVAVFTVPGLTVGTHSLSAGYAQQGSFLASSATGSISVSPAATTTTLSSSGNPSAAGPVTFTAAVAPVVASTPPTGTVTFYDGATVIGTGTMNAAGVATLTTSALSVGTHSISASYAGDTTYLPSSASAVSQLVYAMPGSGTFVIGDLNAAVGNSVTFWGAQWAKLNALSGGAANNSFKGYANGVSGASWATDPGNSSNPPSGPLPAYIGVIVTNRVNKAGSDISGAVVRLVVVKTNAGYDANPGHEGTGTIVAIVP